MSPKLTGRLEQKSFFAEIPVGELDHLKPGGGKRPTRPTNRSDRVVVQPALPSDSGTPPLRPDLSMPISRQVAQELGFMPRPEFPLALIVVMDSSNQIDIAKSWLLEIVQEHQPEVGTSISQYHDKYFSGSVALSGEKWPALLLKRKENKEVLKTYHIYAFPAGTATKVSDDQTGFYTQTPFIAERISKSSRKNPLGQYRLICPDRIIFYKRNSEGETTSSLIYNSGQVIELGVDEKLKMKSTDFMYRPWLRRKKVQ